MRILLSAYACEPRKGSEPGVGWSAALLLSDRHDVWVLTRANNRPTIERELATCPLPRLHFVYYDLPPWARWWKRRRWGVQLYYYLWQMGVYGIARRLYREIGFDLIHHVTFGKYWAPSPLQRLPVPFVWGPVGGAESAPKAFWSDLGLRGILFEALREFGRWCGDHDPLVRLTIRRSAVALAKAGETAERLRRLGARDVRLFFCTQLLMAEVVRLIQKTPVDQDTRQGQDPLRFISIGRLLHLKGFHLGLRAFARASLENAEYWIIGDGPERRRLEIEARTLGIAARVRFFGWVPQEDALRRLADAHVLVHPALHDSGGGPILEAMALRLPVICLDLGGPALRVTEQTGIKIPARHPRQVERDLAEAMRRLAGDHALQDRMGRAGHEWSVRTHGPEVVRAQLDTIYRDAMVERSEGQPHPDAPRDCVSLPVRDPEAWRKSPARIRVLGPAAGLRRTRRAGYCRTDDTASPGSPRVNILGVGVSPLNMGQTVRAIEAWIAARRSHYVCITNIHGIIESQRDDSLRRIHNTAGLVTPDGMPLVWASHLLGFRGVERVYGPDLVLALCERSADLGYRHYFFGGAPGVADRLARRLQQRFPGLIVAGTHTPPFHPLSPEDDDRIVQAIKTARPDIVWVGLSTPKQERWMASHVRRVGAAALIGVGAAFDFLSGSKRQAPRWMQRSGLEWLFRLMTEPRRLWRRYATNIPAFLALFLLQATGLRRYRLTGGNAGPEPMDPWTSQPAAGGQVRSRKQVRG